MTTIPQATPQPPVLVSARDAAAAHGMSRQAFAKARAENRIALRPVAMVRREPLFDPREVARIAELNNATPS